MMRYSLVTLRRNWIVTYLKKSFMMHSPFINTYINYSRKLICVENKSEAKDTHFNMEIIKMKHFYGLINFGHKQISYWI